MSDRTAQIGSVIRAEVQSVLSRGINDPRVKGLVSVTKVEVTADLSEARVFVSILPEEHSELTMHGLTSAAGHIQHEIAPAMTMKRMPRLSFRLDESLKKQAEIDAAIGLTRRDGDAGRDAAAEKPDPMRFPGTTHPKNRRQEEFRR